MCVGVCVWVGGLLSSTRAAQVCLGGKRLLRCGLIKRLLNDSEGTRTHVHVRAPHTCAAQAGKTTNRQSGFSNTHTLVAFSLLACLSKELILHQTFISFSFYLFLFSLC